MNAAAPLLEVRGVSKSYAGVAALTSASLELQAGEVHALVGENGAGKSTLIKAITGAITPDSGEILLDGKPIEDNTPAAAKALGIAVIYQQPALFPELTVEENISFGLEKLRFFRIVDWKTRRQKAQELLDHVGANIRPDTLASELSMPQQQLVEIARAVGADARVIIFDEPTASLSDEDTRNLFRVIRELRGRSVGMIYISHRLEELPIIADRVTVLRDGRTIETRPMASTSREELIQMMIGRELSAVFPKMAVPLGDYTFEVRHLSAATIGIKDVSFAVRKGEILGIAGLVGAGRTELAKTIFGLVTPDSGQILLNGRPLAIRHPIEAIGFGIAYLPEDRRKHGVVLDLPISTNITLASLSQISRFIGLDLNKERSLSADLTRRLGVKTPAIYNSVATLSGGNQQKVALSRWLLTKPSVLILDEPTQGIDVGAKAEIHQLMTELAGQGVAIVMISSELPEILGMSDRIAVMRGGTIVETLDRSEASQDQILAIALGHER
jgi:rhamnose transport system ATP-binding protein